MAAIQIPQGDPDEMIFERISYLLIYHKPELDHTDCRECRLMAMVRQFTLAIFDSRVE
jgi:hypothetical protein